MLRALMLFNYRDLFRKQAVLSSLFISALLMLNFTIAGALVAKKGQSRPVFNTERNVSGFGNESDFFRAVGVNGNYVDPRVKRCNNGDVFDLLVYAHNSAKPVVNGDGSGPSVANQTKVKVTMSTAAQSNFSLSSRITATNAKADYDTLKIRCTNTNKRYRLTYVTGSAYQKTKNTGTVRLSDSIVTTGVPVSSRGETGKVWAGASDVVHVRLKVKLTEQPANTKPKLPATSTKLKIPASTQAISTANKTDRVVSKSASAGALQTKTTSTITVKQQAKSLKPITPVKTTTPALVKQVKPVVTCERLNLIVLDDSQRRVRATVTASVKDATVDSYTFTFGDGATVKTNDTSVEHQFRRDGKYLVRAYVSYKSGVSTSGVTSPECAYKISFTSPKCEVAGKTSLPASSPDCVVTTSMGTTPSRPAQTVSRTVYQSVVTEVTPVETAPREVVEETPVVASTQPEQQPVALAATTDTPQPTVVAASDDTTEQPTSKALPNTGAGGVIALFFITTGVAVGSYQFMVRRLTS